MSIYLWECWTITMDNYLTMLVIHVYVSKTLSLADRFYGKKLSQELVNLVHNLSPCYVAILFLMVLAMCTQHLSFLLVSLVLPSTQLYLSTKIICNVNHIQQLNCYIVNW